MTSRQKTRVDSRSDVLMAMWKRPCSTADGRARFMLFACLMGVLGQLDRLQQVPPPSSRREHVDSMNVAERQRGVPGDDGCKGHDRNGDAHGPHMRRIDEGSLRISTEGTTLHGHHHH